VAEQGTFGQLVRELGWIEPATIKRFDNETNHDIRAALVCLLTAGFAAADDVAVIGDHAHGWFWLPPKHFWQPWAVNALDQQVSKLQKRKFATIKMWTGSVFR
jgi:hypothetical protein